MTILVDYSLKMEKILEEMRVMFASLKQEVPTQLVTVTPLEVVPNIFIDIEVILLLKQ